MCRMGFSETSSSPVFTIKAQFCWRIEGLLVINTKCISNHQNPIRNIHEITWDHQYLLLKNHRMIEAIPCTGYNEFLHEAEIHPIGGIKRGIL